MVLQHGCPPEGIMEKMSIFTSPTVHWPVPQEWCHVRGLTPVWISTVIPVLGFTRAFLDASLSSPLCLLLVTGSASGVQSLGTGRQWLWGGQVENIHLGDFPWPTYLDKFSSALSVYTVHLVYFHHSTYKDQEFILLIYLLIICLFYRM